MSKRLNELKGSPRDPNTPESQDLLRDLLNRILENKKIMAEIIADQKREDSENEAKRNF